MIDINEVYINIINKYQYCTIENQNSCKGYQKASFKMISIFNIL